MSATRRVFLRNSALTMVGVGALPSWLARTAFAAEAVHAGVGRRKKILVTIFQRGAADGLNVVVPHGESPYYDLRPTIAIPRSLSQGGRGNQGQAAIDLDGFFGLHPALDPLKPLWDEGHLAIVHAAGSPDPTRSHFDAQDYMESGTPGVKATTDGWLNRAMTAEATAPDSPLRAVAMSPQVPRSLQGHIPAVANGNLASFRIGDNGAAAMLAGNTFESMYDHAADSVLRPEGRDTFQAISMLKNLDPRRYQPAVGALYPNGGLGNSLKQLAQLIKADVGVEVAFADVGGWDTHINQGNAQGQLAARLREFAGAISAFWADLGERAEDVVVVTMSEFGRTVKENGNRGTDHGHANAMFVLGGPVRGGKVFGHWPGLAPEQLYEGRGLAVTTDFRDVLGEVVGQHLRVANLRQVFPGYTPNTANFRNFLKT